MSDPTKPTKYTGRNTSAIFSSPNDPVVPTTGKSNPRPSSVISSAANKSQSTAPVKPAQKAVNTVSSDNEEDIPTKGSGDSRSSSILPQNPHPLIFGQLSKQEPPSVAITPREVAELKTTMREYTTAVKSDFHLIMAKLATMETMMQNMQADIQVFKKSTSRFVSHGPESSVERTVKLDF